MKSVWKRINDILSWLVLIAVSVLLVFTVHRTMTAQKTGESVFMFGYRPIVVLTGSMEPYMLTNSVCLTKQVAGIEELEVGDVVTYHVQTDSGKTIRITHRIIEMQDGNILTKGDNNFVDDGFMLTIDNIESKVVCVFNQTAWIADRWSTTGGKIMLICFGVGIILMYFIFKTLILSFIHRDENEKDDEEPDDEEEESLLDETDNE